MILPSSIVGTVVYASGKEAQFVLDGATGKASLGVGRVDPRGLSAMGPIERKVSARQVSEQLGASIQSVEVARYRCPQCKRWVDLTDGSWQGDRCSAC